jgi:hypothetical protein
MGSQLRGPMRHTFTFLACATFYAIPIAAQAPATLKWGPAPAVFRPGAKLAVVSGDPTKPGPYVVRLSMPSDYTVAPHFHPTDENVTVKSGQLSVGMGDKIDRKAMRPMKPGEKLSFAANMHHYVRTSGRTVVEVSGMGPFVLTYVNPADNPMRKK